MSPEAAQEAQDVKARYGATHYAELKAGLRVPGMYYKQEHIHYNDNTSELVWVYLSYANLWLGSSITEAEVLKLKAID